MNPNKASQLMLQKAVISLFSQISGSAFAVLIVFVFVVVGLAIAITKYMRNKNTGNEITNELSLKSSQGR